jgi:hypothetical protein
MSPVLLAMEHFPAAYNLLPARSYSSWLCTNTLQQARSVMQFYAFRVLNVHLLLEYDHHELSGCLSKRAQIMRSLLLAKAFAQN